MMATIDVVVETPRGSKAKYAYDPGRRAFVLKHIFPEGMTMPFDFGYVPGTVADDGDPLDVVVISEIATFPGCEMKCLVVGALTAEQREAGEPKWVRNDRLVVIPSGTRAFANVRNIDALDPKLLEDIDAFFENYHSAVGNRFKALDQLHAKEAVKLIDKYRHE